MIAVIDVGVLAGGEGGKLQAHRRLARYGLGDPLVIPVVGFVDAAVIVHEHVRAAEVPKELPAPAAAPGLTPVLPRLIVDEIALELTLSRHREAPRQVIRECPIHVGVDAEEVPLTARDIDAGIEFGGRLVGDEADRARRGVAPVKRTLRTFQHLDLLHVHQLEAELGIVGEIDLVQIDPHGLCAVRRKVVQADASQGEDRHGVADGVFGRQVRRHRCQIDRLDGARRLQRRAAESVDGHRHVLQILFALLCRNDDFVECLLGATRARAESP